MEVNTIPQRIASYDAFVLILMNDEEFLDQLQLPGELDPTFSKENFMKVCFVVLVALPTEQQATSERIFDKLFSRQVIAADSRHTNHNCVVMSENDPSSLKTLSFLLGLIVAR